jgi:predicted ribosomally synthesized peptide with SipW-like signal peptide
MNKILSSLSIIGVAAIVIGGTYAYFSKTMIAENNTFAAGNMTMTLNNLSDDLVGPALKAKNFYPGSFA